MNRMQWKPVKDKEQIYTKWRRIFVVVVDELTEIAKYMEISDNSMTESTFRWRKKNQLNSSFKRKKKQPKERADLNKNGSLHKNQRFIDITSGLISIIHENMKPPLFFFSCHISTTIRHRSSCLREENIYACMCVWYSATFYARASSFIYSLQLYTQKKENYVSRHDHNLYV